jgi:hypothetical protein
VIETPEDRGDDAVDPTDQEATDQVAANETVGEPNTAPEDIAGDAGTLTTEPANAADTDEDDTPAPRERPAIPGADLEVDIVGEGVDPLVLVRRPPRSHPRASDAPTSSSPRRRGDRRAHRPRSRSTSPPTPATRRPASASPRSPA